MRIGNNKRSIRAAAAGAVTVAASFGAAAPAIAGAGTLPELSPIAAAISPGVVSASNVGSPGPGGRADPAAGVHGADALSPSPYANPSPYYLVSSDGVVWPLGGATSYGDLSGDHLEAPIIGVTVTPDHKGYWLVAGDGGIFSFGDATFYGSTGSERLNAPIIGMTATPDGRGYWLYAGDGGIFSFGDATFYGSTGSVHLNRPIVGMAAAPKGRGYWLYAGDGGIFSFGDAGFYGSTGSMTLAQPIVSMASTKGGRGYWLMGRDGGIFSFGDATFAGSLGGTDLGQSVARVIGDPHGDGYWEVAHNGDIHSFGAAVDDSPPVIGLLHTDESPGDVAMDWAMAQIGIPYVWGGTGPAGFDCSGLVLRAWQAAGASPPRVAADQYNYGTHVTMDELVDGDLVYWATDPSNPATIEHVAMYIGGGNMINAPYTGQDVRTDSIGGTGFEPLGSRP